MRWMNMIRGLNDGLCHKFTQTNMLFNDAIGMMRHHTMTYCLSQSSLFVVNQKKKTTTINAHG